MQIKQCITQTQKSVRLFIKRKVETAPLFFNNKNAPKGIWYVKRNDGGKGGI